MADIYSSLRRLNPSVHMYRGEDWISNKIKSKMFYVHEKGIKPKVS